MSEYERRTAVSDEPTGSDEKDVHDVDQHDGPADDAATAADQVAPESDAAEPVTAEPVTAEPAAESPSEPGPFADSASERDPFAPDDDDEPLTPTTDEAPAATTDGTPFWAASEPPPSDASGTTTAAAEPAPARSALLRPRNLILVGLAVILLLVAGIFGPTAWQVWSERDVRLATPQRIGGLELDDSKGAHDTVDYLRTAVETSVTLDKTTGAVYAESSGEPTSVVFVGGVGTLVTPADALDKSFGLITDEAGGVDNVHELPAGPLGGVMKCGSTTTDGNQMAVCGWADHGSLGIAMFPNRPVDQSAELLRTMRKAMQNRG
jgi:hypothetical protein